MILKGMRCTALVAAGMLLVACGDEGSPAPAGSQSAVTVSQANRAPMISGSPATAIVEGQVYSFTPTASDPDGNALSFSISGKPVWATFDTGTGRLAGTPRIGTVGNYPDVRITVSDGTSAAALAAFSIAVQQSGDGVATLTWLPPTSRTDGSLLTNLAGYRLRWGHAEDMYPNLITITNPGLTAYVVDDLAPGTYYFVLASFDSDGVESADSMPVSKTI